MGLNSQVRIFFFFFFLTFPLDHVLNFRSLSRETFFFFLEVLSFCEWFSLPKLELAISDSSPSISIYHFSDKYRSHINSDVKWKRSLGLDEFQIDPM